jgi:transposase
VTGEHRYPVTGDRFLVHAGFRRPANTGDRLQATRFRGTRVTGDRRFIDAVLFRARTGLPWRDLPERFGPWKSVYDRFANWTRKGHWAAIFRERQFEIDDVGSIVDGSVVRAHQDASGGKGGSSAMLWAALEEVFRQSSTSSSTRKRDRSTSRKPRASATR